jgi:hypothetical protein
MLVSVLVRDRLSAQSKEIAKNLVSVTPLLVCALALTTNAMVPLAMMETRVLFLIPVSMVSALEEVPKCAKLWINVTLLVSVTQHLVPAPTPTKPMDLLVMMETRVLKPTLAELAFVLVVTPRFALHLIRVTLLVSANLPLVFVATLTRLTVHLVMMVTRVLALILALLVSVPVETPWFAKLPINVTMRVRATPRPENVPTPRKRTVPFATIEISVPRPTLVGMVSALELAKCVVALTEVAAVLA